MPGELQFLARAVALLRSGGLVAFPTETVYGLGADADNAAAVARVFAVKGRPNNHPLILHIADAAHLEVWAREISDAARQLATELWPGPLTLILPRSARVSDVVTGGADTVGIRVPAHPLALALLREHGGALAAPSANRFGAVSPTSADHVRADLGSDVDLILDGGPCSVGVESTIVDLTGVVPVILRPGGVSPEVLGRVLGRPVAVASTSKVAAPGLLPSHYAPRARVVVTTPEALEAELKAARANGLNAASLTPDINALEDSARSLYSDLRALDAQHCDVIFVTLPKEQGLGVAIADRLRKAAGPRER